MRQQGDEQGDNKDTAKETACLLKASSGAPKETPFCG